MKYIPDTNEDWESWPDAWGEITAAYFCELRAVEDYNWLIFDYWDWVEWNETR